MVASLWTETGTLGQTVEIPQLQFLDKFDMLVAVPQLQYLDKVVDVFFVQFTDGVDVPVLMQRLGLLPVLGQGL